MSSHYVRLEQFAQDLEDPHSLKSSELELDDDHDDPDIQRRPKSLWLAARTSTAIPWTITIICALLSALRIMELNEKRQIWGTIKSNTYTPVEDIAGYRNVQFTQRAPGSPFGDYEGSSPETGKRWSDLYNYGMTKIPKSMADKLVNKTLPISGDPDHYIVELNVFHELHCLNMFRQRLWMPKDATPPDPEYGLGSWHLSHCIDNLRQSLMCSVDATPLPMRYDPLVDAFRPSFDVLHTCRDFDAIATWAKHNAAFPNTVPVPMKEE